MGRERLNFLFLNIGHFYDHLFVLIFATVAALTLARDWGMSYAALIPYATPGFIAFGVGAVPAGWIADKWRRDGMMIIFFVGIGTSSVLTALAQTPLQIGFGLFAIGLFASIYHPVGLAMVVEGRERTGVALAINGVYGNLGVAAAALVTGVMIDTVGWRSAFVWPGVVSILTGLAYAWFVRAGGAAVSGRAKPAAAASGGPTVGRRGVVRVFSVILVSTAIGGLIFQSTTFALPKIFDERLGDLAGSATEVGGYAFIVVSVAAFAQLVVGYLVDRYSIRTVFAFVAGAQVVLLAAMTQMTGVAALAVAVGFMLAVFGQIPINDVLVGRITRGEWRSRIYAVRYIVTLSVAASAVPMIAWVHAVWGFSVLFPGLAVAAAVILIAVLTLPGKNVAIAARSPSLGPAE